MRPESEPNHTAAIQSIIQVGNEGTIIHTECSITNSLPGIIIVGLGTKAVDEAKERIRSAFASSLASMPRKRITINLAPADIPKDGTSLDLAIAATILASTKQISQLPSSQDIFIGKLGLDGTIRPVRGIIGLLLAGKNQGIKRFYLPYGNMKQAVLVPGIIITPLKNLNELYLGLNSQKELSKLDTSLASWSNQTTITEPRGQRLSEIVGQEQAKRALSIAAAGGHNIMLSGPPGTGKSMLAKSLIDILPPLSQDESLEVTQLHSLTSANCDRIMTKRPFRAPHHSASHVAIAGGGHSLRPGEISLSHRGILFFDEFPEFSRQTIETLRQPLEDAQITISRAKNSITYPADFIFVATSNPCPCGYAGSEKACRCPPQSISRYRQKISGPIVDRIDLFVNVHEVNHEKLLTNEGDPKYDEKIRQKVLNARSRQSARFNKSSQLNSAMTNSQIRTLCELDPDAQQLLNQAAQKLGISARSYMRLIKVSRTIADLEGSIGISPSHIAEALQYRPLSTGID